MRVFSAVAESGGFTAAAQALGSVNLSSAKRLHGWKIGWAQGFYTARHAVIP